MNDSGEDAVGVLERAHKKLRVREETLEPRTTDVVLGIFGHVVLAALLSSIRSTPSARLCSNHFVVGLHEEPSVAKRDGEGR